MEGTSETLRLMVLKANHAPEAWVIFIRNIFLTLTKEISVSRKKVLVFFNFFLRKQKLKNKLTP